jgi:peroxiredoxin
MTIKLLLISTMAIVIPVLGFSQSTENQAFFADTLRGLRIETKQDSLPKSMKLDGSVPMYNENGKKISGMEMLKALQSGDYFPVRYINNQKEVKAYVLRPTTEEEKNKLKNALASVNNDTSQLAGKPAKPFSIKDMTGKTYSLQSLKGKVVVINFWFVECMPCRKEIPELNSLVKKYKTKEVVFLGIADSEKTKIAKFLQKTAFTYTIVPKDVKNKVLEDYAINSYPTHIIIDKDGNVRYYAAGFTENTIESITKMIDSLIK